MFNWIRNKLSSLKSTDTTGPGAAQTKMVGDLDVVATVTVTYQVLEGTDAQNLLVHAKGSTEFHDGATDLISNAANTAVDILTDKPSVGMMYKSIVSNMLYVPSELRDKPN